VEFLLRSSVLDTLVARHPSIGVLVKVVGGPSAVPADVIATILCNLGPFVAAGNRVDPKESLQVILAGLQEFVSHRLRTDIEPALRAAIGDDPDVRIYLDEVLIASLEFATGVIFDRVSRWASGDAPTQKALREACSALVMKLLGRTLVVTADILLNRALE